jgi:triosephosphate isomerase
MPAKPMRRMMAGTGWKMNHSIAATRDYAAALLQSLPQDPGIDVFVLPPFTALETAGRCLNGSAVAIGGQNMHWEQQGAWTGEISASMLLETGCQFVELAHSERLAHFCETYALVRKKLDLALDVGLKPILCIGELADEKAEGRADAVLESQIMTALAGTSAENLPHVILAYEPRWAIGGAAAASPDYVAERHGFIRQLLARAFGAPAAQATRIIYGGSVSMANAEGLATIADVDGLFAGRSAWNAEGLASLVSVVVREAQRRQAAGL